MNFVFRKLIRTKRCFTLKWKINFAFFPDTFPKEIKLNTFRVFLLIWCPLVVVGCTGIYLQISELIGVEIHSKLVRFLFVEIFQKPELHFCTAGGAVALQQESPELTSGLWSSWIVFACPCVLNIITVKMDCLL